MPQPARVSKLLTRAFDSVEPWIGPFDTETAVPDNLFH